MGITFFGLSLVVLSLMGLSLVRLSLVGVIMVWVILVWIIFVGVILVWKGVGVEDAYLHVYIQSDHRLVVILVCFMAKNISFL